ncbi:hypothetical protein GE061_000440 [Apolygus lucorum]|uniref:Uncharacterized protein n=1 Tax=Apolygus lucorum TaxID=248454 RepID=A0A8S9Y498_APOLU|nr:hypothetical protein GE061_000440 [Apolygus lucorum]
MEPAAAFYGNSHSDSMDGPEAAQAPESEKTGEEKTESESPTYLSQHGGHAFGNEERVVVTNEISAPYEVPQFPIEQIESKLATQRVLTSRATKEVWDKKSVYEPSIPGSVNDDTDKSFKVDEYDYVPHFQRVSISGEDVTGSKVVWTSYKAFDFLK